jgi:HSP20 family protein
MNHLVGNPYQRQEAARQRQELYVTPLVDVQSTPESVVLSAEMAGVNKGGVEISVESGNLILVGHRQASNVAGDPIYLERRPVHYRRVYELDPSIDTEKITARVEDGILTVTLPKSEKVKPKKITLD